MQIKRIVIIEIRHGPDLIILHTDLPSTMPKVTEQNATFELRCAKGYGLEYITTHFPEVTNIETIKNLKPL